MVNNDSYFFSFVLLLKDLVKRNKTNGGKEWKKLTNKQLRKEICTDMCMLIVS